MKNVRENLKKTVLAIMVTMLALNVGLYRTYAEEETVSEPAVEEVLDLAAENEEIVEMTVAAETENAVEDEAEETIEEIVEEAAIEEIAQVEEEAAEVIEEKEEVVWKSYTLYNYISLNEGRTYISLNTQENGISAPKSPVEFQKEHGNKRYDLSANEYEIAGYDLSNLVIKTGGYTYVEQSVAKEGQPYFVARLDRVEAVAAANFRPSDCVEGIQSFTSLDNSNITFHRNWYLTLVTPKAMTYNKLLTGVRLGDGKNGNGDGKYYGLEFTENFLALDSRTIPFGTKLSADQYSIADYDFTNVTLTYKGETYAYRPNGPVAGDGEAFHYYTVSFMKVDKLNKSTYGGGYLTENWPAWSLINSNAAGTDGFPYLAGYYHRDYQATLMVGDAPAAIEEEIVEEVAPIEEEKAVVEEVTEEIKEEEMIEVSEEEAVIEEEMVEEIVEEEAAVEEIAEAEIVTVKENAPVQEAVVNAPVVTVSANTNIVKPVEIKDAMVPQAAVETVEIAIPEAVALQAAPEVVEVNGSWALVNLVCVLVAAASMIIRMNGKGIIPAALAILFFLLTEDMSSTMVLADNFTLTMVLFALASLLIARITRNEKKDSDLIDSPAI
ncbi:MAG: hypothetical protein II529_02745 [Erysipelotrichaceae bacterium]|nr:hypothetical protein [Erysipelotrichaceae bacterium]